MTRKTQIKEIGKFCPEPVPMNHCRKVKWEFLCNWNPRCGGNQNWRYIHSDDPATEMLPGYKEVRPMVFSGLYPLDTSDYEKLKKSVGKTELNDAVLSVGNIRCFGFWFPLRIPRSFAHGNYSGAFEA